MNAKQPHMQIEKIATHIPGFDLIAAGGLPRGHPTLVSGTSGSAKTIFACQFLAEGIIKSGESGVFVTCEESPQDIRRNMMGLGWDIDSWEAEGKWVFVDASPQVDVETVEVGSYDLGAMMARIEYAIGKVKAVRLSLDSLGAILSQFSDSATVRRELFRIATKLKKIGVTAVITAERTQEYGEIARFGVEEFVTDNVIILRNVLEEKKRHRTIEILKFRGTNHQKGEYPFSVMPSQGIIIIPLSSIDLKQKSSTVRITSGNEILDQMCGGGFLRDSIILVSGATGCGKTMMVNEFMAGGIAQGERGLLFAFEESREQLTRNARSWGIDYEQMEKDGKLKLLCEYPEVMCLEDQLIKMMAAIDEFKPNRVAIDSLSALERFSNIKSFREFVIRLTSFIKHKGATGLLASSAATLMGGASITDTDISTITDVIILLRYVEMFGQMRRGLTILKMRGSTHDKDIREYTIDSQGMHLGKPFSNVTVILGGAPGAWPPAK
jgi:circadian clock protein KaiC